MDEAEQLIRSLIAQRAESKQLDYKATFDIAGPKKIRLEIVKDIAAMLSVGGYIVIGADDNGDSSSLFSQSVFDDLDETKIRNLVKKYIAEPFEIRLIKATVNGHNYAVIDVAKNRHGFAVIHTEGQYQDQTSGKSKVVFSKGTVYVRHGSASEMWEQHDIELVLSEIIASKKAEWIQEMRSTLTALGTTNERTPQQPSLEDTTDPKAFYDQLESAEFPEFFAPIKRYIKKTGDALQKEIRSSEGTISEIELLLDKLLVIGLFAIREDYDDVFKLCLEQFSRVYGNGFGSTGQWRLDGSIKPPELWNNIHKRIVVLGAELISRKKYALAKELVLQRVDGSDGEYYPNWYRHALVMASRNNMYYKGNSQASPLLFANEMIEIEKFKALFEWDADEVKSFLVQFDFIAALVAIDDIGSVDTRAFYTAFAFYGKHRIVKMLKSLLVNSELRKQLFPNGDKLLARALTELDEVAQRVSFIHWDVGWDGEIAKFIQTNLN